MPQLKFYDLKKRKSFTTDKYQLRGKRNPRTGRMVYMAVAKAPSGSESYRIVSSEFYKKNK